MRSFLLSFAAACLCVTTAVAQVEAIDPYGPPDPAVEVPLEGEALTALFMDKTHRGYYQFGDWDDADPAFVERMNADGTTVHERDGVVSPGTWRARANVVCFAYEDLDGGCFNMYQRGNCYYAMSASSQTMIAVSVLDGETPDCEPSYA
ncbi:hypothetical protein [uncultured Algimonas sp.]|uniref:hypothetical protein n=1 Tax=uncultured Algimonas sp. TaxID=1547920 RepID=UPI00262925C7|nr:hypothetical protein [uncultured Algimonas sp.]